MRLYPSLFLFLTASFTPGFAFAETRELTLEHDVRPILKEHCFHCHGEGDKLKGGVDLRLRRFMEKPTKDGDRVMVPGKPEESEMIKLVKEGEMPEKGKKLTPKEIATLSSNGSHKAPRPHVRNRNRCPRSGSRRRSANTGRSSR
jgi:mono/diheme cytochrome c family protein